MASYVTVNKRDQIQHESELCDSRTLKCHSCGEMTKTLTIIEERIAKVEMNTTNMRQELDKNMEKNKEDIKIDMERKLEAMNNEVRGLKTALKEGFNEMKEVLVKMELDMIRKNTRKGRGGASGDKENILVVGGVENSFVETFNWRQKLWSPLQSLPKETEVATAFVYKNHVTVTCEYVENTIRMNIEPHPHLLTPWSECAVKLPKLALYSSVVYKDQLIVTGGSNGNATSDCIDEVQLVPPYAVKTLFRMPEPRQFHRTELFDDSLLIVGGRTTQKCQDNLSSVVLYDIKKKECKQLAPLPYEVSKMATVRWGDNVVVIGGVDRRGKALDTVFIYNVKTEQYHMLPSMRCTRYGCTVVVIGNNIVVLGGHNTMRRLKSVEAFNFDRYTWEELPEMSQERSFHTAVVV